MHEKQTHLTHVNHARQGKYVTFGDARYAPGGTCGPRQQEDYQIVLILSGEAVSVTEHGTFNVPSGYATLQLPGQIEEVAFSTEQATHHQWAAVHPFFVNDILRRRLDSAPKVLPLSPAFKHLLHAAFHYKNYKHPHAISMLDQLGLTTLFEYLHMAEQTENLLKLSPLDRAIDYMETHLDQQQCLQLAASHAGITQQHLGRLFKKNFTLTPARWLWKTRAERAADFLQYSGLPIATIAEQCGFQSLPHFSRIFKQQYQVSPTDFRKQLLVYCEIYCVGSRADTMGSRLFHAQAT